MKIIIQRRRLSDKEIDLLVNEIRKFPNPLTGRKTWSLLKEVFIVSTGNDLVGVCGVIKLKNWIKLGPFVVFEKFHNKGFGKRLFNSIITQYFDSNLFVGSRNPAVAKIALRFNFKEIKSIWELPSVIRWYLLRYMLKTLNLDTLREFIRKKPTSEGPYRYFIKQSYLKL
jgi:hypothetical protein